MPSDLANMASAPPFSQVLAVGVLYGMVYTLAERLLDAAGNELPANDRTGADAAVQAHLAMLNRRLHPVD